ncbi:hypothetical protein HDU99_001868 [Rhizoclosmatium hyalinum]|nr:hypothetical protein HDU99_001868 [Rhizoclosmatium hyalinum]
MATQTSPTSLIPSSGVYLAVPLPFPLPGDGVNPTAIHFGPAAPMPPGWPSNIPWPPGSEIKPSNQTSTILSFRGKDGHDDDHEKWRALAPNNAIIPLGISLGVLLFVLMSIAVFWTTGQFARKTKGISKEYTNGEYARWLLERNGKQLEEQCEIREEFGEGMANLNEGLPSSSKQGSLKYTY